jgi:2'-5' RNA ligase
MRLFVAVELPADVKDALSALETSIPGATWVRPAALHLTLRFLGDNLDPIRLTPIKTALASVKAAPFPLTLRGVGRFPPGKRPARVLWVGIDEQPALLTLQASVERALSAVGFEPEDRPFSPHITLARLKGEGSVEGFIEKHSGFRAETFTVSEFVLMSSVLTPHGPNYRREAQFPLREPGV